MFLTSKTFLFYMFLLFCLLSCQSQYNYSSDPVVIANGQQIFEAQCSSCHNFQRSGMGPALGGVTKDTTVSWLREFIANPGGMIDQGELHAVGLHKKYRTIMPSFQYLEKEEVDAVLAFMNTHTEKPVSVSSGDFGAPVENPIPDTVAMSDVVLELRQIAVAPTTSEKRPLARINKMIPMPGESGREFVSDLNGVLYEMKNGKLHPFLKISEYFDHFINSPGLGTGLGSFDFHPDFRKNGLFYTTHTEDPETSAPADFTFNDSIPRKVRWVLTEWKISDPENSEFSGSHRELMRVDMVTGIHGMQEITFDPGAKAGDEDYGLLYVAIGDGGATGQGFPFLARHKNRIWGNILRIDPSGHNSANGHYGIPTSNPSKGFKPLGINNKPLGINGKSIDDMPGEIFAMGFRNPHRIFWDKDGRMFASNIGQHGIEELNLIEKGRDYGWPEREGTFMIDKNGDLEKVYPLPQDEASAGFTYPVLQFDHDVASAISSGYVYYGSKVQALQGKYFFGGISNGRVFYAEAAGLHLGKQAPFYEVRIRLEGGPITTMRHLIGDQNRVDLRFGCDQEGEMYILTKSDGKIYKIVGSQNRD